jgi:hypothetical protein
MTRLSIVAFLVAVVPAVATAAPYVIPPPPGASAPSASKDPPVPEVMPPVTKSAVQPDHPSAIAAAACADRADSLNNVVPGLSKMQSASKHGDFWVITMSSGHMRSICTVSRNGQVMDIVAGGY